MLVRRRRIAACLQRLFVHTFEKSMTMSRWSCTYMCVCVVRAQQVVSCKIYKHFSPNISKSKMKKRKKIDEDACGVVHHLKKNCVHSTRAHAHLFDM